MFGIGILLDFTIIDNFEKRNFNDDWSQHPIYY